MDIRQEILDIPRALRETLEKGRPEYEALVRRTRWADGPIYVLGSGAAQRVGLTGTYAFESLLGWPVIARSASDFATYSLSVLRPRSVVLAVSKSGESAETLETARAARARGAVLLGLTNNPTSSLAALADGVFLIRAGAEPWPEIKTCVCLHAAISYIGLVAAQTLKRHHPLLDGLEEEFATLPGHAEWVLTQLADAVRSFASALKVFRRLCVVGGGFYHPVALQCARLLRQLAGIHTEGLAPVEPDTSLETMDREVGIIFLSGSRCRASKKVRELAAAMRKAAGNIFSVTDGNDRELVDRSMLAVLLPTLSEMVGSVLTLVLLGWVAYQTAREQGRDPNRVREISKS